MILQSQSALGKNKNRPAALQKITSKLPTPSGVSTISNSPFEQIAPESDGVPTPGLVNFVQKQLQNSSEEVPVLVSPDLRTGTNCRVSS